MMDEYASAEKEMLDAVKKVWPDWKIEEELGNGSFGHVYRAVKEEYNVRSESAIKMISIPANKAEVQVMTTEGMTVQEIRTYYLNLVNDVVHEIQMMESLKGNPNIVGIEDFKVVEKIYEVGFIILIRMELLTPFSEYAGIYDMTEKDVAKLGIDICNALKVCAEKKIIHRDIKPENIFVNEFGVFKLGDFGIARQLEDKSSSMSQRGTFNYMAPEIERRGHYNASVDVYSLGLVLYKCLNNNRLPFLDPTKQVYTAKERNQALRMRLQGEELPRPVNASNEMWSVLQKACAFNSENRYQTAAEFQTVLKAVFDNKNVHTEEKNNRIAYKTRKQKKRSQIRKHYRKKYYQSSLLTVRLVAILIAAVSGILFLKWEDSRTAARSSINNVRGMDLSNIRTQVTFGGVKKQQYLINQYVPTDGNDSTLEVVEKLNMASLLVHEHKYQWAMDVLTAVRNKYRGFSDEPLLAEVYHLITEIEAHWPVSLSNIAGVGTNQRTVYDTYGTGYTDYIYLSEIDGYGKDHPYTIPLNSQYDDLVFTLRTEGSDLANGSESYLWIYVDDELYTSVEISFFSSAAEYVIDVSGADTIGFGLGNPDINFNSEIHALIANGLLYTDWLE